MIIQFVMHIWLAVILDMVIFPLAFLKFSLSLIWPQIRRKRQFLALFAQNRLWLTASGKLIYFLILLRSANLFHNDSMDMCEPCAARYLTTIWQIHSKNLQKTLILGNCPMEGGISQARERRGKFWFVFRIPRDLVKNFHYDVMGHGTSSVSDPFSSFC